MLASGAIVPPPVALEPRRRGGTLAVVALFVAIAALPWLIYLGG